jgi:ABC-2 type transport system permease protein
MTSAAPPVQTARLEDVAAPSPVTGFGRLLLSEWTKIRSVRSTIWSLILLVVATLGFTGLFTWLTILQWDKSDPSQRAQIIADPVSTILGSGLYFGQLTICVLGVLVITSEYSTGVIRASLLAVPRRIPMLVAKAIVFAVLVLIVGEIVTFSSFFVGAAILHQHAPVSLSDPGVARAVFGAGLYLAVLGLFALAIGGIIRHTAGAITGVIAFVLVLAPLTQLIPGKIGKYVHGYLPTEAGHLIGQAHQQAGQVLSPWQGFGVFCLWTAVLLLIAGYLLKTRDA